jgi:hypothetical protein
MTRKRPPTPKPRDLTPGEQKTGVTEGWQSGVGASYPDPHEGERGSGKNEPDPRAKKEGS